MTGHYTSLVGLCTDHLLVGLDIAVELVHRTAVADPEAGADILQHVTS